METYNISQLKSHISEAIRSVKNGNSICILDRETPVATLVPVLKEKDDLKIRFPEGNKKIASLYTGISVKVDFQKILLEDRNKR